MQVLRELPSLLNRQLDFCSDKLSLRGDKEPFLGAFLIRKQHSQHCGLAAWFLDATVKKLTKEILRFRNTVLRAFHCYICE